MDPTWPVNYFVPNFGKDHEIINTEKNIADTEKNMGKKMAAQWGKPVEPPRGYFIPNFGMDKDIVDAQSNIASSEATLKSKWEPTQDANGVWMVPEASLADSYSYDADNAALLKGNRYTQAKTKAEPEFKVSI